MLKLSSDDMALAGEEMLEAFISSKGVVA